MASSKWKIKLRDYEVEEVKNSAKTNIITKEEDPLMTDTLIFPQKKKTFFKSYYLLQY